MRRFYFLVFVLFTVIAFGQIKIGLPEQEIPINKLLADSNWLYSANSSTDLYKKGINDSGWQKCKTSIFEDDINKLHFTGFAWFRRHICIDSSYKNTPLVLNISQEGASEIYFNGILVKKIGVIGRNSSDEVRNNGDYSPIFISPKYGEDNVIAIKYSNKSYNFSYDNQGNIHAGFRIGIDKSANLFKENTNNLIAFSIFGLGLFLFFATIGFIYFLLFIFYKQRKSNLYFALFCCFYGYYPLHLYITNVFTSNAHYIDLLNLFVFLTVPFFGLSLIAVLYSVFYTKFPRQFRVFFVLALIIGIFLFFAKLVGFICLFLFSAVILIEVVRVVIIAVKNKLKGSRIIGTGFAVFTVFILISVFSAFMYQGYTANGLLSASLTTISIISIPLSMSIFLAWDFSQTNKNLKQQLLKNEELSAQSLAQEREKQDLLANQNRFLEEQVEERTLEINEQKKELQLKNVEITDSINYSKHIQLALLPELDDIQKGLPGSFILYQPKDIVSGDFYWFKQIDKSAFNTRQSSVVNIDHTSVLIAAADCTGHGVPGALMSLIAIENLNKAVDFENEPQKILELVNKNIKNALKQNTDKAAKDGMDIALCKIEQLSEENFKVTYSAANRPLWVVRKNATEIEELKATKTAIGGHTDYYQQFEQHTIEFKKGDSFYIFSDGYADQFGSTKNKKLTTKRFKEILLEINQLSPNEQKHHLNTYIHNWRGKLEQIDDILIIGLKF